MRHLVFIIFMMLAGFMFSHIAGYYAPSGICIPYTLMAILSFSLMGLGIGDLMRRRYK